MASKKPNLSLNISAEEVLGWELVQSGDYKYASVGVKKNDDELLRITYEWRGDATPDFVMSLMGFMQANEIDKNINEEEYAKLKERT